MWKLSVELTGGKKAFGGKAGIKIVYCTAFLDAVERSVHSRGPSRLSVVNYFANYCELL